MLASMADDPADQRWSSYRAHAFGTNVKMWTPHPEYRAPGATKSPRMAAYRGLFDSALDKGAIKEIRKALNTGPFLGNERFRTEIEQLPGQRRQYLNRGPKPKARRQEEFLL
jgi:putative transposase